MAIVDFVDSDGREWTVYQVQRSSSQPGTVTPGRENGWLVFSHGQDRRRLAPVPHNWEQFEPDALRQLCAQAEAVDRERAERILERRKNIGPSLARERRRRTDASPASADSPEKPPTPVPSPLSAELVALIQERALAARAVKQTAVAAMMDLRALLNTQNVATNSDSFRAARRLFLETFYFRRS
jgi:hypothetical protein